MSGRKKTIEETAYEVALAHLADDEKITEIYVDVKSSREIKLLEISSGYGEDVSDLFDFAYAPRPDLGIDYVCRVILLNEAEWLAVKSGQIELPANWNLLNLVRMKLE